MIIKRIPSLPPHLLLTPLLLASCETEQEILAERAILAEGIYALVNVHADKCLDVAGGSTENGANVQLYECNGGDSQAFALEQRDGAWLLRNARSDKCLDIWAWSTDPGANVAQYECHGGENQQFDILDAGGVVRIVSRWSGLALDGWRRGTANGTNVAQWTITGGDNQHFELVPVDGGPMPPPPPPPGDGPFACDGDTSGYDAVVTRSGDTWTARRGNSTVYTGSDMRSAIQTAMDRLSTGRTRKESVLVQGSGSISATSRISVPSYTVLNVCGTIDVIGTGSGDNAPIYARGRRDIEIPNVTITGSPAYGMFFRDVDHLRLGRVDLRVSSGLGIRIDNHGRSNRADKVDDIKIDSVYVEGTRAHGVETYGANDVTIGTIVARNTGYSGLLLNDSTNVTVERVDAQGAGTGTGYAAFRMANRNGRLDGAYPTNIRVGEVLARGGGRGVFCVSESGGAVIDRVVLEDTGSNAILIENCYGVSIDGGTVSGGGGIRLAARSEFANNRDITLQNLTVSDTSIVESPCATNGVFRGITLRSATMNVCD